MSDIHKKTENVVAWLRKESNNSHLAIKNIKRWPAGEVDVIIQDGISN